jgi:indolepyruvate ferredoxin oxidoreductase alpha subunit
LSKELLSGNEAIARGAWEAGVKVAVAYPGTPSTEILENLSLYPEISSQWSPNEKVALEVAIGASVAGARSLATMKHVGLNVASDALMTLSYTGVNGGLVIVSADDPGIHSSQNEQDNRFYGRFARVPVLEPSDSQEAKDFVRIALNLSEALDTAVLFRTTTRISHSKSIVETGERQNRDLRPYSKDPKKYVMVPGYARMKQPEVLARFERVCEWSESTTINHIHMGDRSIGIITSGISYQYVLEACPDVSILKLGMSYPLPYHLIRKFAAEVNHVMVIEELEPFLAEGVRLSGISIIPSGLPRVGELSPAMVEHAIRRGQGRLIPTRNDHQPEPIPARPPVLCPGCPHRGVFHVLRKMKLTVSGDIGCYTLGALPPLNAMDIFMCMGASVGMALGMEKANPANAKKTVAVIGDSTFLHSGMTGLLDMVYNRSTGTVLVLDNGTTAMTGHQDHPATGKTLMGEQTIQADIELIARGLGVRRVKVVDPFDTVGLESILKEELTAPEVSVVIARHPCVLIEKTNEPAIVCNDDLCRGCKICIGLGCPAMSMEDGKVQINEALCTGCALCADICPFDALQKGERK